MAKGLSLLDKRLVEMAANGATPDEMEESAFIPAAQAITRVKEILASQDIWDEVEQRRLAVYSLQKLKGQVEASGIDATNPKMVEAYTKLLAMVDRLQSKTAAISDSELERLAVMQASRFVQVFEMAYGRARQLLSQDYPEVDLGRIDDVMWEGLRQSAGEIEAG